MENEIQKTELAKPPESWTSYGACSVRRKTATVQGESPILIESSSRADAEAALREIDHWLAPLPEKRMYGLLGELYLKTARRTERDDDKEGLFRLYARELARYPGDLLANYINNYRGTFFPVLAEIQNAMERDWRFAERRRRREALCAFLGGEQCDEPRRSRPTTEQIRRNERYFSADREPKSIVPLSDEKLAALEKIDRMPAQIAHRKKNPGKWKPIAELRKTASKSG